MAKNKVTYVNEENMKDFAFGKTVVKGLNGLKNYLLKYLGLGTAVYAVIGEAGRKAFNLAIGQLTIDVALLSDAKICEIAARALSAINAVCPAAVIAVPLMAAGGVFFGVKTIIKAKSKKGKAAALEGSKTR